MSALKPGWADAGGAQLGELERGMVHPGERRPAPPGYWRKSAEAIRRAASNGGRKSAKSRRASKVIRAMGGGLG